MGQKEIFLTEEGLQKLMQELEHLRTVRRQEVADQIQRAREMGGAVNNAEYEDAKNEQAFVEGRILDVEKMIQNAVMIHHESSPSSLVELGSKVTVQNQNGQEDYFVIVGSVEVNPGERKISNESPVGQALIGKKMGDTVEVAVPAGVQKFTIKRIE